MKLCLVLALSLSVSAFAQKTNKIPDSGGTTGGMGSTQGGTLGGTGIQGGITDRIQGGIQAGTSAGKIQGGTQGGTAGGIQGGTQGGVQGTVQGGTQGGTQGGVQGTVQGGTQGGTDGVGNTDRNPNLPDDPMGKNCAFLGDDGLKDRLTPGAATLQALRDQVAAMNQSNTQANANCALLGQQVQNLLDQLLRSEGNNTDNGGQPNAPDNRTWAQKCQEERQRGNASCGCDPVACRARIQALTTQAAACGESREGMIDAITGIALKGASYLGPVGSLVGLGITVFRDVFNLFKKKRRATEAERNTQVMLNRNLACITSKTWYNTMCADNQLDYVMEAVEKNPPRSSVTCQTTATESADAREALGLVYQCLQDGQRGLEQCLACHPMKIKNPDTGELMSKVYSPDDEEALRDEIGRGATTDLAVRQTVLPDMIVQARQYHKDEVQRLYQNIRDGYASIGRQGNQIGSSFKSQEYRQLIRHCYLGYLSQKIQPPQLDIILATPRDREFTNICNQLNSCLQPKPENMFSYENFERQEGRSVASMCSTVYSIEKERNSALRIEPMRRLLTSNAFGDNNGCGLNRNWTPSAPQSAVSQ